MLPLKLARLMGLGAFGVLVALAALGGVMLFITLPAPTTGISWPLAWVTWISVAVVLLALGAAHVALGRQLLYMSRDERRPV